MRAMCCLCSTQGAHEISITGLSYNPSTGPLAMKSKSSLVHRLPALQLTAMALLTLFLQTGVSAAESKRLLIVGQGSDGHPPTTHEFMAGAKVLGELLRPHKAI